MQHRSTGGFKVQRLKVAALLALAVMMTALLAAPASADQPVKWVWDPEPITEPVLDLCPFDVQLTAIIHDQGTDYFDKNGVWYRTLQHAEEQDTFVGPTGRTLVGMKYVYNVDVWSDADGSMTQGKVTAVEEKVMLPSGKLMIISGFVDLMAHPDGLVFYVDKGNPGDLDALCEALAP
jgi:hypothetical protein